MHTNTICFFRGTKLYWKHLIECDISIISLILLHHNIKHDRRNSGGEKREKKRERKLQKERKEICPQDVPKMLLAEMLKTIDILTEMLKI